MKKSKNKKKLLESIDLTKIYEPLDNYKEFVRKMYNLYENQIENLQIMLS